MEPSFLYIITQNCGGVLLNTPVSVIRKQDKIHWIPGVQPNLHRIDKNSTKWIPDRQFCIEKSIWNLSHIWNKTHRMEEKNSNWIP